MPLSPSSRHIVEAEPATPLYAAVVAWTPSFRAWKPPWACNLVLITSNGQLTIPETAPAMPPDTGMIAASGMCLAKRSKLVVDR